MANEIDITDGKTFKVVINIQRPIYGGCIGTKDDVKRLKKQAPESVKEDIKSASVFKRIDGDIVLEEKHLKGHLHAKTKGYGLSHNRIGGTGFVTTLKRAVELVNPFIILGDEDDIKPSFNPAPRGRGISASEIIFPDTVEFKVKILNEEFLPYFQKMMQSGYFGAQTSQGHGKWKLEEMKEVDN